MAVGRVAVSLFALVCLFGISVFVVLAFAFERDVGVICSDGGALAGGCAVERVSRRRPELCLVVLE